MFTYVQVSELVSIVVTTKVKDGVRVSVKQEIVLQHGKLAE